MDAEVRRSFQEERVSLTSPIMAKVLNDDQRLRVKLHGHFPTWLCERGIAEKRVYQEEDVITHIRIPSFLPYYPGPSPSPPPRSSVHIHD